MTDFYKLLEIANSASTEVIHAAYRVKVKQYHPDNYHFPADKESATKTLQLLNEAVNILTDSDARRHYDAELEALQYTHSYQQSTSDYNTNTSHSADEATLAAKVQTMIRNTKTKEEYLTLHRQISSLPISDRDRAFMSDILDELTAAKLADELVLEKQLESLEDEVKSIRYGMIFWLAIGILLTPKFNFAILIGGAICLFAYIGGKEDRVALQQAQEATKDLSVYRANGFRI